MFLLNDQFFYFNFHINWLSKFVVIVSHWNFFFFYLRMFLARMKNFFFKKKKQKKTNSNKKNTSQKEAIRTVEFSLLLFVYYLNMFIYIHMWSSSFYDGSEGFYIWFLSPVELLSNSYASHELFGSEEGVLNKGGFHS